MAEVFGAGGQPVEMAGAYACSQCGHRESFTRGTIFPPDHHEGHPWTLMVADDSEAPEQP